MAYESAASGKGAADCVSGVGPCTLKNVGVSADIFIKVYERKTKRVMG